MLRLVSDQRTVEAENTAFEHFMTLHCHFGAHWVHLQEARKSASRNQACDSGWLVVTAQNVSLQGTTLVTLILAGAT
jgi:hypothetical protein